MFNKVLEKLRSAKDKAVAFVNQYPVKVMGFLFKVSGKILDLVIKANKPKS